MLMATSTRSRMSTTPSPFRSARMSVGVPQFMRTNIRSARVHKAVPVGVSRPRGLGRHTYLVGTDVAGLTLGPDDAPLVRRRGGVVVAGDDGRATGQQGVGEGGAAVVPQRAEEWSDIHQVSNNRGEAAVDVIPNQVVAQGGGKAGAVRASGSRVLSDDSVD